MTDRLTRGDDAGLAWDNDLFDAIRGLFPSLGLRFEPAGAALDVGSTVIHQLAEEFRVH